MVPAASMRACGNSSRSPWNLFESIVQARILAYKATETNFSWFKLKAHSWSGKDTAMAVPGPDREDCPVGPTDTEPWEWPLELLSLPLKGDDWLYLLATPIPAWIPRGPFLSPWTPATNLGWVSWIGTLGIPWSYSLGNEGCPHSGWLHYCPLGAAWFQSGDQVHFSTCQLWLKKGYLRTGWWLGSGCFGPPICNSLCLPWSLESGNWWVSMQKTSRGLNDRTHSGNRKQYMEIWVWKRTSLGFQKGSQPKAQAQNPQRITVSPPKLRESPRVAGKSAQSSLCLVAWLQHGLSNPVYDEGWRSSWSPYWELMELLLLLKAGKSLKAHQCFPYSRVHDMERKELPASAFSEYNCQVLI